MKLKRVFIDDILIPNFNFDEYDIPNSDIETTCLNCGLLKKMPNFIYDEISRKKYLLKFRKRVSTLYCSKC